MTITGNRIEWNEGGGIRIIDGSHYNVTGNYIDRCGPGIMLSASSEHVEDPTRIVGRVGYSTISGNMLYRSARPEWDAGVDLERAHLVLRGARGLSVTGNTFVCGRDDENNPGSLGFGLDPNWSPNYGMVLEGLENSVIRANAMDSACTRELIRDLGSHGPGVVMADNPGSLFPDQR